MLPVVPMPVNMEQYRQPVCLNWEDVRNEEGRGYIVKYSPQKLAHKCSAWRLMIMSQVDN